MLFHFWGAEMSACNGMLRTCDESLLVNKTTMQTANAATFPNLPVPPAGPPGPPNLTALTANYMASRDAVVATRAAAEWATTTKKRPFQDLGILIDALKKDLRHAETITDFDDDLLKRIGWSGRKPKTDLLAPGQCRALKAPRQGEGWVFLDWKQPIDGGKPAAYKIQRRERPDGFWTDISMSLESETTLSDQTRGTEWKFRVIAVNKAGKGQPSNTVMAVL